MKTLILKLLIILNISVLISCNSNPPNKVKEKQSERNTIIDQINIILDNSGSMSGYLNGKKFKENFTEFIAELDKIKRDSTKRINNINFYTLVDNMKSKLITGNPFDFIDKIKNQSFATIKTSPLDDCIKQIVDSSDGSIDILVTDLVVDRNDKNFKDFIQSKFNLIFNIAKSKGLSLIIFRDLSDYLGKYFPVFGYPINLKERIERPYFYLIIGPENKLFALREILLSSKVFKPLNELSFGLKLHPHNIEVLPLSNRKGKWRFKDGIFSKASMSKDELKFTIALDLSNMPLEVQDTVYLMKNLTLHSHDLNIKSYKIFNKANFSNLIHTKEKHKLDSNSHFLEIIINKINRKSSSLQINLLKEWDKWSSYYSTDDDSYLNDGNNLKTFALKYIIEGIANSYSEYSRVTSHFQINYKINL
ncbi:MAG: hypothetical protein ACUVQP_04345 [Bacteroidales bacterium]